MKTVNLTYDALYEKLKIPAEIFRDKSIGVSFLGRDDGDSVSTDKTIPYEDFIDITCASEQ